MDIEIVIGSVLGASEYVAEALDEYLQTKGHRCKLHFTPSYDEINFSNVIIIVTSTHGAGDLPDNIQAFANSLKDASLSGCKYLLIGLGDTSYDTFCDGARKMESLLSNAEATIIHPPLFIDVLQHPVPEEFALEWLEQVVDKL